ncbi:MAG: c-type cytochrome [Deltaproteobacteria bacterium]|nr:c-type cytochrome [Deltaproteobacteria bacterium]NND30731.1 c-type cytochrome [Myxococcales bacterium]MBT8465257.1 c-type cytochrome [Deltaproteobacteria bacterium]MBT8482489.1 c-type cytochrome [Deltaproteobacteria bacterium]NNK09113.1 c-type cytochrome [Myxococcales bacterium]
MPSTSNRGRALAASFFIVFAAAACKSKPAEEKAAAPIEAPTKKTELPPAPAGFPDLKIPADNPQSPEKVALGQQLFFDARLSVDGTRSCYSCHQNEHGNGGETPLAVGAKAKKLTRHSPVIWNTGYFEAFYWDGRAGSLEAQAKGAWGGGNMGVGADNLGAKAAQIGKIRGYRKQFKKVFPTEGITPDTIAKAISAYERTLICDDTAYDRYAKGDADALTAEQKRGWALFIGKGQCAVCHAPPLFSNAMGVPGGLYYNAGIGTAGKPEDQVDVGRYAVTEQEADWAAFKVPSLRNVSKSAPYFHDGSVTTLPAAVELMASGGIANKNLTPLLADRGLSDEELTSLVAFLGALDCGGKLERPDLPK